MPCIRLYPHNRSALECLTTVLEEAPGAAVIQPTGTGKSFVALAFIEDHPNARFLYLSPSTHIFTQLRHHAKGSNILRHTDMLTYQKLCFKDDEDVALLAPDYIILDEFHRCGAEEWGSSVSRLLSMFSGAKHIGLSATPIRYLDKVGVRDMAEELFGDHIAYSYSLCQAMTDGVLPIPKYILADILMEEKLKARQPVVPVLATQPKRREQASQILRDMRRNLSEAEGVESIFAKHLSPHAKLIVFCRNLTHIEQAKMDMGRWLALSGMPVRAYTCRSDDGEATAELSAFIKDTAADAIRLLFCVDMLNEGLHVKDVDGIVMLRPTESPTVYLQQIGRCLASTPGANVQPVIFDLVNNYESARIDGSEQRAFTVEFLTPPLCSGRKPPAIHFVVSGNVAEFQCLISKFDRFVSNWGRWEYFYGILKDCLAANGCYPLHRELFHGVRLGFWLSHQVYWLEHNELPEARAALLRALPGWNDYIMFGRRQKPLRVTLARWSNNYARLKDYLYEHPGSYPPVKERSLYFWCRENIARYRAGILPNELNEKLEALPGWMAHVSQDRQRHDVPERQKCEMIGLVCTHPSITKVIPMLQAYVQANAGNNPPMSCYVDGYPLGRKVNQLRQFRKKGCLSQSEMDALSAAGMIWELRRRSPAKNFDTYYAELVRYYMQHGNINVPQSYVVPNSHCKLGIFIQRMRLLRKRRTTGTLTEEQAARLDTLGMVWDATTQRNKGDCR